MKTTEKIKYNEIVFNTLMILGFILLFALFSCDSTKGEMIDGPPVLTISATVDISGIKEVGANVTFTAHISSPYNTWYKFYPDYKNNPGMWYYSITPVYSHVYDKAGFYIVKAEGHNDKDRPLLSEGKGVTINEKFGE